MAVVFISPKQRQKNFLMAIAGGLLLFLVFAFVGIFFTEPNPTQETLVFNKAKVDINMSVFNSERFKNLVPFTQMENQYSYVATNADGKQESGSISASSEPMAITKLQSAGLKVVKIEKIEIGRENPFAPYYQQTLMQTPK